MRKDILFTFFLVSVGVTACSAGKVEVKDTPQPVQLPALEFAGVVFEPESFRGMRLGWNFELTGRDSRPVDVGNCNYRLELEGLEPISGNLNFSSLVTSAEKKLLEIRTALPWPSESEQIREFLGRQKIPYKIEISCQAGEQKLQAGDSGNIPLQKLPRLTVSGANAERFSGKEFRLNFELALANENAFAIQVKKINYRISVEGKKLSEGTLPVEEVVAASADTIYEISSGMLSVANDKSLADLLKKNSLNYRLEGEVEFEGLSIQVDETGSVSFPR